jgi:hypothetical protein
MCRQGKIVAAARASEVSSKRKKDEEERRKHPDSGFDSGFWAKMKANCDKTKLSSHTDPFTTITFR